jgi:peroxiredoxin (alkyl hydroperoxide reductase subunit C)
MLTIGDRFPSYSLHSVVSLEQGAQFALSTGDDHPGKWRVIFFWPMDFTFVCPTEITEFGRRNADFVALDAQVLGVSTDTHWVHLAWREQLPALAGLPFPMLADTSRELCEALGILHKTEGVALRATFLVDPAGTIRHLSVNDLGVGRSVDEVLRVLSALQTDELTPCGWQPGEATLIVA